MTEAVAFVGGRIFTGRRYVEAVLIEDGRVVAAGTRAEVDRARPTGAETVDLAGRLAVPGLIDSHLHLAATAQARDGVDLRGVASPPEMQARARRWVAGHPDGPIFGAGWDQEMFRGRTYPTRVDLDRISSERPIVFERVCGHVVVVNSRVLAELSITDRTPDPEGGRIGRGADGHLNGVLFDRAIEPVRRHLGGLYRPTPERARSLLAEAAALGLTTLSSMSATVDEVRYLEALVKDGPLGVRIRFYVEPSALPRVRTLPRADGDPAMGVTGLKVLTDGSLGGRTAWLSEPYDDAPGEYGLPLQSDQDLAHLLERAEAARLPVALHAIGDRALRRAFDLLRERPGVGIPRIEHASLAPPGIWGASRPERVALVVQPSFVSSDRWLTERVGEERTRWAYPFHTLLGLGFPLAGSSDCPVETLDPRAGIRSAVYRGGTGPPRGEAATEALSVVDALALYTRGGGQALGEPNLGHLEPGASADLIVLNGRSLDALLSPDPRTVGETWCRGRRLYAA